MKKRPGWKNIPARYQMLMDQRKKKDEDEEAFLNVMKELENMDEDDDEDDDADSQTEFNDQLSSVLAESRKQREQCKKTY